MQNTGNINRIKAVLAEQNRWVKTKRPFLSGVQIPVSQV